MTVHRNEVAARIAAIRERWSRPVAPDGTCGCTVGEEDMPFVLCDEHARRWGSLTRDTLLSVIVDWERGAREDRDDLEFFIDAMGAAPRAEGLEPAHVIDRHGFVWRVVRDGGMATRADYTGITSIGIEELRATRGPLTDLEAALAAR